MERQEFLKSLGISFATICAGACLSSCGKDEITDALPLGNFVSINLVDIPTKGSFKTVNKILFVRIEDGNSATSFIAVQSNCPHQNGNLQWNKFNKLIECELHGARYNSNGTIINEPRIGGGVTKPLKTYEISVTHTQVNANINA